LESHSARAKRRAPCVFASRDEEAGVAAPLRATTLESSEVLEGGAVWLRYKLEKRLTHLFARRKPMMTRMHCACSSSRASKWMPSAHM
jgi:hypothetical protein